MRLVLPVRVQIKRSPAGTTQHTGRGCTALPSPTTRNLRPSVSNPGLPPVCVLFGHFYPCLACRQRCRMLDHCAAIQHTGTPRRAASSHASRPWALHTCKRGHESRVHVVSRAFRLEGSKPLETKRRGENNRKGEFWYKKSSMIKMRQIVPGSAVG